MSLFNKGKPKRVRDIDELPSTRGEYRFRDEDGNVQYIGISEDLKRRAKEHRRTGKFRDGMSVDYMEANPDTSYRELREHERKSIKKYNPPLNKKAGGGGKTPKAINTVSYEDEDYSAPVRAAAGLIRYIKIAFRIIVVLAIILAIVWVAKEFIL